MRFGRCWEVKIEIVDRGYLAVIELSYLSAGRRTVEAPIEDRWINIHLLGLAAARDARHRFRA